MAYEQYAEDFVSDEKFEAIFQDIKRHVTADKERGGEKCTVILGGQPGAGKSTYYRTRTGLEQYISINGDEFRGYHPNFKNIARFDPEHYAERTQPFSNKVVERLISELGSEGYNLIIEGTLRNPNVAIKTCEQLKDKGYTPELVVVACDAQTAWESTINRAKDQNKHHIVPRLVPLDIYNNTVHSIPESLDVIENRRCFERVTVMNRDGEMLYRFKEGNRASHILENELHLDEWDKKFPEIEADYIKTKIDILQEALNKDIDYDAQTY